MKVHEDLAIAMRTHGPGGLVDVLLARCPDAECAACAAIVCPHECCLHFHHDGCPACAQDPKPE